MRTIIYGVMENATGKIIYSSYHMEHCTDKIKELGEGYELRYNWRSL